MFTNSQNVHKKRVLATHGTPIMRMCTTALRYTYYGDHNIIDTKRERSRLEYMMTLRRSRSMSQTCLHSFLSNPYIITLLFIDPI